MLDSRLQGDGSESEGKSRKSGDSTLKEGIENKGRNKGERSTAADRRESNAEKGNPTSSVSTKKSIVDRVDLGKDRPISEVEKMIQHKLLQKKQSGQGSSTSEQNGEGHHRHGLEGLPSENDILNEFRGVETEGYEDADRSKQSESKEKGSLPSREGNNHFKNSKNNFQEEYEAEEEGMDDPMLTIWGGPRAPAPSSRLMTKTGKLEIDMKTKTIRPVPFKKTTIQMCLASPKTTTRKSKWLRWEDGYLVEVALEVPVLTH